MTGDMKGSHMPPHISSYKGSLCSQPEGFISSLSHRGAKAFCPRCQEGLIRENSDYSYRRSELNMPVNWSSLFGTRATEALCGYWFSTHFFWGIIQSVTGNVSSPGSDWLINTVHSLPAFQWQVITHHTQTDNGCTHSSCNLPLRMRRGRWGGENMWWHIQAQYLN